MTEPPHGTFRGRFTLRGRTLRQHTARGAVVNAVFLIAVNSLAVLRGVIVMAFLTPEDYGLFGLLIVSLSVILWLKQVGVGDRYVQQDEDDQELAFQRAFTLEAIATAAVAVLMAAAVPVVAWANGDDRLLGAGFFVLLGLPALVLQVPLWVHYRRMNFVLQRALQSVDPIVTFVVTIVLAAAGAGYWALLIGAVAGQWAAALAAVVASPYRLRWRFDRSVARGYVSFSWPLVLATGASMLVAVSTLYVGQATLGLAAAGAIVFATTITQYADRVDQIVSQTMYPAICAVKDRTDVLFEAFVKSNRLALMWGLPFGVGVALFAADLVELVVGPQWAIAIGLLQAFGLIAAANHVGFNWSAFFQARGDTRPAATIAAITAGMCVLVVVPLLAAFGLEGLAAGMAALVAATLAARLHFVRRLFPQFRLVRHVWRAVVPTAVAAGAVLALRALDGGVERSVAAGVELSAFVAVCLLTTWLVDGALLREAASYVRGGRAAANATTLHAAS